MTVRSTHVEVYLFRRRRGRSEFLALRRSPDRRKLPGVWQPVTGSRGRLESPLVAAAREVAEETGLTPKRWWSLETITAYVDPISGALNLLPLFAAEVDPRASVELSEEHDSSAWLVAPAAGSRFLWESQRRGLEAVRREILDNARLAAMLEVTHLLGPGMRSRTRTPPRAGRADGL
jgi:8-oxo-dGTP pyrophosphatase MutT (NUDIX family)